ncbi:MAG TPA: flippase [Euzebyales bacterium]|nr:flippase [Euzebyales bacterium]
MTAQSAAAQRAVLATAKGSGFLAGGSLYEFAARFVIAFLLARLIGADGYGLYSLAISAAALFTGLSALGLDDAMVRYVAIMRRRGDDAGLWGTLQLGLGVATPVGVLMGLAMYVAADPIAVGLFDEPRLAPLLRMLAVLVPFLTLSSVLNGCARGFGRMDYATLGKNVVQSTLRMVLLGLLALGGMDVRTALIVFGVSDVAASLTLLFLLNREFAFRRPVRQHVRRDVRGVFGFALPLWLSGLLKQFQGNIETVLLGALANVTSVGIYALVGKVNMLGHVAYRAIIVAVKPVLAGLHDGGDRAGLSSLYATTTRWTLALNVPFFLVVALYAETLLRVFGQAFVAGREALVVLAVAELAVAATGISGSIIDMTGHVRVKLANTVLSMVALLTGSMLLIPRWGMLGAAVAFLIAVVLVEVARLVEVWVFERLQPYRWSTVKPLLAGLVALGLGLALRRLVPHDGAVLVTALECVVVLATYLCALLLLGLAPEDRVVLQRILHRIGIRR